MPETLNLLEARRGAGICLAPTDDRTRFFDHDKPGPFIGVVYYLEDYHVTIHTGFAPPSNN